jgi:hypothetical protein
MRFVIAVLVGLTLSSVGMTHTTVREQREVVTPNAVFVIPNGAYCFEPGTKYLPSYLPVCQSDPNKNWWVPPVPKQGITETTP